MKLPNYLKKGDKIGILSTARKISLEALNPTVSLLEDWGLEVVVGETIGASYHQFAGDDALRTKNLQTFLDDDSIKAILCARGGYGTLRIIDNIRFDQFVKNPKWICGFSDVTVLHAHIWQNFQIPTIHSAMPSLFPQDLHNDPVTESLHKALWGEQLHYEFLNDSFFKEGIVNGIVIGGNLSLLFALQGSSSDLNTEKSILFIEDLDEYLYHLDRMMVSLDRSGKLGKLGGLIVGGMTEMKDNEVPFGKEATEIIWEHVSKYHYPVCFNFPAGHIKKNMAIRLGMPAFLKISKEKNIFTQ